MAFKMNTPFKQVTKQNEGAHAPMGETKQTYESELKELERSFKMNKIGGNELREKKIALLKKYKKA
jgi:hypothetical protein